MSDLKISVKWERLEEGTEEERACFGMLTTSCGDLFLTEGLDCYVDCSRKGPLVSGYHFAEWIAWNWWRLTNEPKPLNPKSEWDLAHRMSAIGAGYIWPNITIFSDRERTVLVAKPTQSQRYVPFRFTTDMPVVVPTLQFEAAAERYIGQIQSQLRAKSVPVTNLDTIWEEIQVERADPKMTARRRLEALLGFDPDEDSSSLVEQLIADASHLGQDAIQEIAADHQDHAVPSATELEGLAKKYGYQISPADMVSLTGFESPPRNKIAAWRLGYMTAQELREQQRLGQNPLDNRRLAELYAVSEKVLEPSENAYFSFSIDDETGKSGELVLRSKWETGRRFDLARLLGDRLTNGLNERLLPATHTYTYRQKLQRAFAAELLCPFEALEEKLRGDYSSEAREDAAHYFKVSERTVTTMLVNHHRLDRDYLGGDLEALEGLAADGYNEQFNKKVMY